MLNREKHICKAHVLEMYVESKLVMQQDSYSSQNPFQESLDPPQLPFPEAGQPAGLDVLQLPFPAQQLEDSSSAATQMPFPQQLPSTETIDMADIGFQATRAMQVPGMIEVSFATQSMPNVVHPYMPSQANSSIPPLAPSNQEAKRAIINGVISFIVSIFSLITVAGFAGLIVGTFAIIYGLRGLRLAKHMPNQTGRRLAFIGIALGLLAWSIIIMAAILRAPQSS